MVVGGSTEVLRSVPSSPFVLMLVLLVCASMEAVEWKERISGMERTNIFLCHRCKTKKTHNLVYVVYVLNILVVRLGEG